MRGTYLLTSNNRREGYVTQSDAMQDYIQLAADRAARDARTSRAKSEGQQRSIVSRNSSGETFGRVSPATAALNTLAIAEISSWPATQATLLD